MRAELLGYKMNNKPKEIYFSNLVFNCYYIFLNSGLYKTQNIRVHKSKLKLKD